MFNIFITNKYVQTYMFKIIVLLILLKSFTIKILKIDSNIIPVILKYEENTCSIDIIKQGYIRYSNYINIEYIQMNMVIGILKMTIDVVFH